MVKSEMLFDKLVCIDTLLTLDGIIPSLPEFKLKLVNLIEQFYHHLLAENLPMTTADALCKVVCRYFDQKITISSGNSLMSWDSYALTSHFYGYEEQEVSLHDEINSLLKSDKEKICVYATQLLMMIRTQNDSNQQSAGCSLTSPATVGETLTMSAKSDSGLIKQVVFIIGPFAATWFREAGTNEDVRFNHETIWLLAPSPKALKDRLIKIAAEDPDIRIMAFFPILPDGYEDDAIMHSRLDAWFNSFAMLSLAEPLICTLGLYGRFSNERSGHDPDKAIWVSEFETQHHKKRHFTEMSNLLIKALEEENTGLIPFPIQRKAMAEALMSWLDESGLSDALQQLFSKLPFSLSGITLADYGTGFIRHGAWSRWLDGKYGILPGLTTSLIMPPIPTIPAICCLPTKADAKLRTPEKKNKQYHVSHIDIPLCIITALMLAVVTLTQKNEFSDFRENIMAIAKTTMPMQEESLPSETLTISAFSSAEAKLTAQQEQNLYDLLPHINQYRHNKFLILGFSDNTGTPVQNMRLSVERASTVREWIVQHSSLPAENFETLGIGEAFPIDSNAQEKSRANNRRVEIIPLD
ncbi:OmpA family protein [Scandinavium goeteborgense]|uniref:OmpA family protein n=1 Tax=Scandinavium goeteborgense TaxID=1851514 RepID=UPI0037FB187E